MTKRGALGSALRAANEQVTLLESASNEDLTADRCLLLLAELGRRQGELRDHLTSIAEQVGLPAAGKDRLLRYLILTKGKVVDKDELSGVSGIYEWARRLRELRLEDGWSIASDKSRPDLRPGQYVLEASGPQGQLRDRWRQAHAIRTSGGSATSRLKAFFRAHVGVAVGAEELFYVSRILSFPRRIRELAESGWDIHSNLDHGDLKPGEYRFSGRISATSGPVGAARTTPLGEVDVVE